MTLLDLVDRLVIHEAAMSHDLTKGLARQFSSPEDFGDAKRVIGEHNGFFMLNWQMLVDALLHWWRKKEHASGSEDALLVIPIDDADLRSNLIPNILTDIFLMSSPNVVFLFTACRETLLNAMYVRKVAELFEGQAELPGQEKKVTKEISELTQSLVNKILPPYLSVEIQSLTLEQRLRFRPLKTEKEMQKKEKYPSFNKLLKKFELVHPHQLHLIDFFDFFENFGAVSHNRPKTLEKWKQFMNRGADFPLFTCWFDAKTLEYAEYDNELKEYIEKQVIEERTLKEFLKECNGDPKKTCSCDCCGMFERFVKSEFLEEKFLENERERLWPSSYAVILPKYPRMMRNLYMEIHQEYQLYNDIKGNVRSKYNADGKSRSEQEIELECGRERTLSCGRVIRALIEYALKSDDIKQEERKRVSFEKDEDGFDTIKVDLENLYFDFRMTNARALRTLRRYIHRSDNSSEDNLEIDFSVQRFESIEVFRSKSEEYFFDYEDEDENQGAPKGSEEEEEEGEDWTWRGIFSMATGKSSWRQK